MRIAYDHQAFCLQKTGGISRYFCRLAQELALTQDVGIFAPLYRNQYLDALPKAVVHGYRVKDYPPKTAGLFVGVNGLLSSSMMRAWHPDLVHETYFSFKTTGPLFSLTRNQKNCPRVVTVFDMISELELEKKQGTEADLRASAKFAAVIRADHVLCISEHTRQDLLRLFDIPKQKTSVIHLGCDVPRSIDKNNIESQQLAHPKHPRPYLLYVGLRSGYKNFSRLLKAIAASALIRQDFDLIAFGGNDFSEQEQALIRQLGFAPSQIRQLGGSDDDLGLLYSGAAAFVYPSTYEGFGLPPLEAMAHNCPVVSSDRSSMPEIIGSAAEFFDPESIDAMAFALERVLFSTERANELRQKGQARLQDFTWQRCAQETLRIYQSLIFSHGTD